MIYLMLKLMFILTEKAYEIIFVILETCATFLSIRDPFLPFLFFRLLTVKGIASNDSCVILETCTTFLFIWDPFLPFLFFRILTAKAIEANDGKPLPLYQKALCGLTAGAIGACVGSPADLALIRMQADATLPAAQRRHYTNAFHALYRIVADEGVLALWKGAGPTVVRAMALNMGMLASYDQSVEFFKDNLGFGEATTIIGKILLLLCDVNFGLRLILHTLECYRGKIKCYRRSSLDTNSYMTRHMDMDRVVECLAFLFIYLFSETVTSAEYA